MSSAAPTPAATAPDAAASAGDRRAILQPGGGWTLVRYRLLQLGHLIDQHLRDRPGRTFLVLVLLTFVWAALYQLLSVIFRQVQNWQLVAVIAKQQIFVHFFLALGVMLAFSNAVLAFGSLFGRAEPAHLMSLPASARQIVLVKWIEGALLSSWSFLLLGVPLMLAVGQASPVPWYFYPLFIGHFSAFVILPSTFGLLAAWAVAMFAPRRPLALALWIGILLVAVAVGWLARLSTIDSSAEEWVNRIFTEASVAKSMWLPSTWTAQGIVSVFERNVQQSFFYLMIVVCNAGFLAWVTINVIGATWAEAYSRAQQGRFIPTIRLGWITALPVTLLFWFLPQAYRMILLKDLRTFARDPAQWTQMIIMLGLLVLYALNLPRLPLDLENPRVKGLIAFLNLTTVSLILATFTSRFVYPMLSLETQQLWLLGLIPRRRRTLLVIKYVFALVVTLTAALGVMVLATRQLKLPLHWAIMHLSVAASVCIGLCGIAVGCGARFPVLGQRNPARIASGFGGTVNLIASMVFVAATMFVMALVTWREFEGVYGAVAPVTPRLWSITAGVFAFGAATAAAAVGMGARHFERLEA
jgi:ABC-2 type transport system permease protein